MLEVAPSSTLALILLGACFVLVLAFEFANGFHDTANAVATVIYTNALKPKQAVVWSGFMNFLGVVVGGIAVAYALVELLPPDTLSPPNGSPAVPMLVSLFATALAWNVVTWWFGIPNSSSHCVIGALIGIAIGNALVNARDLSQGVPWTQVWTVLKALTISPVLGLVGAGLLYFIIRHLIHDRHLYEPPKDGQTPVWWMRGLLVLTCTAVSFSHGTNDGQKSIGLIMLTVIGLMPAAFALNLDAADALTQLAAHGRAAAPLIAAHGDDQKALGLAAANRLGAAGPRPADAPEAAEQSRSALRNDVYRVLHELQFVIESDAASPEEKVAAKRLQGELRPTVEYAPWWVRILSAACLGLGTMVGYRRIVHTLGERLGKAHMTPAQGASAELVGAGLIATAGFTGLPVSTTHIITSGIAGTMIGSGAGLNHGVVVRIALAWIVTLPVTIAAAAGLFWALSPG